MCNSTDSNTSNVKHRLKNSTVKELVAWHQELRESLEQTVDSAELEQGRTLLMNVQHALVSANSTQVDSDSEKFSDLMKLIQNQDGDL